MSELDGFLDAFNDHDLPDAAWFAKMMEGVEAYNEAYGTTIDPHSGVLEWIESNAVDPKEAK